MPDERVLEGWFRIEMAQAQRALVAAPVPLPELLASSIPAAKTRSGDLHRFDIEALRALALRLSPLGRAMLRLPIFFYLDRDSPGDCFVSDPAQAQALRELGILKTRPRGDRHWLSEPLARAFAKSFPSLAQFVAL